MWNDGSYNNQNSSYVLRKKKLAIRIVVRRELYRALGLWYELKIVNRISKSDTVPRR